MSQVLTNKQIMIVDDDAVFRRMLCGYLEAQGGRSDAGGKWAPGVTPV